MDYDMLWSAADAAGRKAAAACTPTPMVVGQYDQATGTARIIDVVEGGVCGFAYIKIRPARGPFVSWLKARGIGHKAYNGGWEISIHDYGQSMTYKAAHARAAAEVLCRNGIGATSYSRMD